MPAKRGRGAVSNIEGRFEKRRLAPIEDAGPVGDEEDAPPRLATSVTPEVTRTILARNDSPDISFDRSINPYKGCEHGCVYCFARPTHSYLGLSPGLDFETRIFSKPDAARLLREELRRPGYRCEVIALGANTDPYQPVERDLRITRALLEVLREHRHPVGIITKSSLVLRDLDLLAPMAAERLASVFLSITTLDRGLARTMEPRAATPSRRLETHYPLKAKHVLSLVRQTHGGQLYDGEFGKRMKGTGPYAELLRRRFETACRRLGLSRSPVPLDTSRFRTPPRAGDQLDLFGR